MDSEALSILNLKRKVLPGPALLHHLISKSAGQATAIDFLSADGRRTTLTYDHFAALSQSLSRQIQQRLLHGASKRHIIPVVIPQCPELYIAWRAVLEAGAAFCPVSPDVPSERLKFILRDVSADLVLCVQESSSKIDEAGLSLARIAVSRAKLEEIAVSTRNPQSGYHSKRISPTSPAYVQYTSGSSGLPKGVVVSHLSVVQSLLAHDEHLPNFKRFLQFASPTFDVSIFEVFFPFFRGATLVGRSREQMLADLPGTIRDLNADAVELTPTVAGTLLKTRSAAPGLKTLLTIGEMLTRSVVSEFGGSNRSDSMLYAMYGPTEAAIHCTLAPRLSADSPVSRIGVPLSTVTTFVLKEAVPDQGPEIVPRGESGELAVAGQLASGYLNRPEQDRAAFVDLPGYGPVYRTGDRVICTLEGELDILGRMTTAQVKLRGQRIELGEIEAIASKTSGLALAVASVIDDLLVLFCVADPTTTSTQIRETCRAWLPSFMCPGDIVILENGVPRLPSGKVDKKQLENDYRSRGTAAAGREDFFANDRERMIATVLREVLNNNITKSTNLWSAGMDSLRAIQITSKLRAKFLQCSVTTLLEAETMSDIFASLEYESDNAHPSLKTGASYKPSNWDAITERLRESLGKRQLALPARVLPCSSMQTGMLAETWANPDLNFNTVIVHRKAGTSHEDLWQAIRCLAASNELLRSGFYHTEDSSHPFAQLVWEQLEPHDLDLLHPLQISGQDDAANTSTIHLHHALYDGWSWELIMDDLNTILAGGSAVSRPSYQAFVQYQAISLSQQLEQGLDFWRELQVDSGSSSLAPLASSSQRSKRETLLRDLDLPYARLSKLAEDIRVSRQAFLQSCWARLLSLYTDSTDVVFGNVISGRHAAMDAVSKIIGPCLATLPMRVNLQTVNTFEDLVTSLHRQNIRSLEHSNLPLNAIPRRTQHPKGKKLFGTLFVWQQGEARPPDMRKYLTTACTQDVTDYETVLEVEPVEDKIQARLTVDTQQVPEAHALLLLEQVDNLLSLIADNLKKSVQCFDYKSATRSKALSISNPVYQSFDQNFDLFTTIANLATHDPQKPAIRYVSDFDPQTDKIEFQTMSYGNLYMKGRGAAAALVRQREITPDSLICLVASKSIDLYVSILAIIMTGAGYMCIDPKTPSKRIKQILQQARCAAVLIDETVEFNEIYIGALSIQEILQTSQHDEGFKPRNSEGQHLAYCIWTSGTTGKPKGVLVTRRNLLSNLAHLSTVYPCDPGNDALLQACSQAFDVSVFEIFWTWHNGMTLCAAPNDVLFRDLEKLINALGVTHLSMTPSVAALVRPGIIPKVKVLVTAGEPMNSRVFTNWAGRCLYQGYGPSETTNICNIRPNVRPDDISNNVGPVFPNTSLFVCSRNKTTSDQRRLCIGNFQILPRGAIGEIWIGGEQVARGYVDKDLTARKFLNHPEYGRLYRSGDIGRLLADDSLVILGRDDDQAKIRGHRIELGEVNGALIEAGNVEDAGSLIYKMDGQDRLLSFCRLKPADQPPSQAIARLFNTVESILPSYMIPDIIMPVERLPLTKQGKIDKRLLIQRYRTATFETLQNFSRRHEEEESDAQLDDIETEIARALETTLNISVDHIGRNSSFFALGLDSINCIRVCQLLHNSGFNWVDVSTIFQKPSIRLLKPILTTKKDSNIERGHRLNVEQYFDSKTVATIRSQSHSPAATIESILPCTDLQLSMLSSSDASNAKAYRNKLRLLVKGNIDNLRVAWESVKARQPLLRTAFVKVDSKTMPYAQVVFQDVPLPWHEFEAPSSADLLFYALNLERHDGTSILLNLEMHHALYDAEAITVLLNEVEAAYHGRSLPMVVPFSYYLDYMINMDLDVTDKFWSKQMSGFEPCQLSNRLPRPLDRAEKSAQSRVTSQISTSELNAAAHGLSTTPLAIIQTSVARLLSCYFDVSDICFGNVFSGRSLPVNGVDRLVGPCFNTLPVRVQSKKTTSNLDLIRQLQNLNAEIMALQPSSPRRIQRLSSADGSSLFDVLLLLQQSHFGLDTKIWELVEESGEMTFPFILEVLPVHETNNIELTLHSGFSEQDILHKILHHIDALLNDTISYPQARALEFSHVLEDISELNLHPRRSGPFPDIAQRSWSSSEALSELEEEVKSVICELFHLDQATVTRQTTIFQLGLDSINAVQFAAKLREAGHHISSATILEGPTVAEIALACTSGLPQSKEREESFDLGKFDTEYRSIICDRLGLNASHVEAIRPCTPTQCGILSEYLRSAGTLYYNTIELRLGPEVNKDRMLRSWQAAMDYHEMLRTGFAESDNSQQPFVMITYMTGSFLLPLGKSGTRQFNSKPLDQPAWDLSIRSDGDQSILAVSMLHSLYDANSMDRILADIARLYQGELLIAGASITSTLASILSRSVAEEAREFWQKKQNLLQPTKFPDLNITGGQERPSTSFAIDMSVKLSYVQECCTNLGCSLQAVCQAAWGQVLAAYCGQQRVTFGLILSGRDFGDDRDEAAFPCINTVPFTIELGDDKHGLLDQISETNAGLIRYQNTPMTSIKRWQAIEGAAFDTILVLQKFESKQPKSAPWKLIRDSASAQYAVSLEVLPKEESATVTLQATYSEQALPPGAVQILLKQIDNALREVLSDGDSVINPQSPYLSVLYAKDELIPTDIRFLHEFVEKTAAAHPNRPALEFVTSIAEVEVGKSTWSYADLDAQGNRVASLLLDHGVESGDFVAVCFDKCPEASFAILGILKAGAAYVAVDPGAPWDRKTFILRDAGCKICLTTKAVVEGFGSLEAVQILVLDEESLLETYSPKASGLAKHLYPEDTCYCLYTSGTTGMPKGCLISHQSAVQAMMAFQRIFDGRWNSESRWLQFASFHFDVSVLEQYWSWSVGICVTSAPRDLLLEDLPSFICKTGITHLDLTPSLARLLSPAQVPSLCQGVFIVGGEQVSQDIIDTWGDTGCLYNFYGPSEVTIGCTVHPQVKKGVKPTNIGHQWENVGSFVLEPSSQSPVIRGAIGELCLSGVLVGKGYLNRPALSSEKFVTLEEYGTRVYRTGDLVRMLHDDSFEFLGRIDDQIKLRGQRLEIGEINQVIHESKEEVKSVATIVGVHPTQKKDHLVAFFSAEQPKRQAGKPEVIFGHDAMKLAVRLRQRCIDKLPSYMVPTSFMMISAMPLSANNKIDSKILKSLYESSKQGHMDEVGASRDVIKEDADAFKALTDTLAEYLSLSTDHIRASSRLFELGIDSVSAIGLLRKLRSKGFYGVDVTTVMKYSVVADLAHALKINSRKIDKTSKDVEVAKKLIKDFSQKQQSTILQALQVQADELEHIAPCTPLQEGMISKAITHVGQNLAYFTQLHLELSPSVDLRRIRKAWTVVQELTSIMRTYFVPTTDGFAQIVLKISAANDPFDEDESIWNRESFSKWVSEASRFGKILPWQIRFSPSFGGTYMTLFIFHGLYDGLSLPLLLDKLAAVYDGQNAGPSNFFELLPHGPLLRRSNAETFWKHKLKNVQRLELNQKPSSEGNGYAVFRTTKRLVSFSSIRRICSDLNVTEPAIFHSAWLLVLHQVYGVNPTLGLVLSGRAAEYEGAQDVIGPMINTLPCTVGGFQSSPTLPLLIKACHRFNIDVLPYQHTAIRDIAKWIGHDARNSIFDTLFVFQKEQMARFEHGLWKEGPADSVPDYPLNLEVEQKIDGNFVLTLATKQNCICFEEARDLLDRLEETLGNIDAGKDITIPDAFISHETELRSGFDASEKSVQPLAAPDDKWTPVAENIREQIAGLAETARDSIGLYKPTIFELGLDSIDAMKLATRLKFAGLKIPVNKIMRSGTVAGIAAVVAGLQDNVQSGGSSTNKEGSETLIAKSQDEYRGLIEAQGFGLDNVERILPVTSMQEGLLLDFQKYYNVFCFELDPDLDIERLKAAWRKFVQLQPILRTRFVTLDQSDNSIGFLQVVRKVDDELDIKEIMEQGLSKAVEDLRQCPDNLKDMPALRVTVVKPPNKTYMVISMPHAAYDAWSLQLLHKELARLYHNGSTGRLKSAIGIETYERYLEIMTKEANIDQARLFWESSLQSLQATNVEALTNDPSNEQPLLLQRKSDVVLSETQNFCKEQGVTLHSLGLACWSLLLAYYTGNLNTCCGVVLSGRTVEGSDQLIFPTFNTVIFNSASARLETREVFVKDIHRLVTDISEFAHFPLKEATKIVRRTSDGSSDLFNTLFTYQKGPDGLDGFQELYREVSVDYRIPNPPYAVNFEMEAKGHELWWTIATQQSIAAYQDVELMLRRFEFVLQALIQEPKKRISGAVGDQVSVCGLPPINLSNKTTLKTILNEPDNLKTISDSWTPTEEIVREVLAVLAKTDIASISKTTSFHQLGLDSISAIKVSGLLKKQGIKLPVSKIVQAQSVEGMAKTAQALDPKDKDKHGHQMDPSRTQKRVQQHARMLSSHGLDVAAIEDVLPAIAGQVYMLDTWRQSHERLFYSTFWFRVEGVTQSKLQDAIHELTKQIPVLRMTFIRPQNGLTYQVVLSTSAAKGSKLPWSYQIHVADHGLSFVWKLHHALYDAVSLQSMITQLEHLCRGAYPAPTMNIDMSSFISHTTQLQEESKAKQRSFWTSYLDLKGFTALQRGSFSSLRTERFLPKAFLTTSLDQLLRREELNIQCLFFAACAQAYSRLLPSFEDPEYVVLGIYLANRSLDILDLPSLACPTFTVVPLKINVSIGLIQAAKEVQRDLVLISEVENCGVSLREIYDWTGVRVDCVVNFLRVPVVEEEEVDVGPVEGEGQRQSVSIRHEGADEVGEECKGAELDAPSPLYGDDATGGEMVDGRMEWVLPSIDIEAKIHDGYLGVGVFAPEDMLDEEGAEGLVGRIGRLMREVQ